METTVAISVLRGIARPVLATAGEHESFPVRFTFRLVLERLESSLGTLEVLIKDDALRHDHSIGLICRNILSDVITTGFLIKLSTTEENLHENLYALYYDDLKRTDMVIKLYAESNLITTEEAIEYNDIQAMPDSMFKLIRNYVDEYKPEPFPGSTSIIKKLIASKKDDPWSIELRRSYDIWIYYSKYEHLGWYAYQLTRALDCKKAESRFKSVLRLATLLLSSCLEMLGQKDSLDKSMAIYRQLLTTPTNAPVGNA
ncbi:MAG: hypothetical protein IPN44_09415 [Flavobacteriales bacterium]|nr:hypothetical protein [Flavobacteriales bacterium]